MRLKPEIRLFIHESASRFFPGALVYLFGSRIHDELKGGDIDLLVLSDHKIDSRKIRKFKIDFYTRFGWQKIDIVNFTHAEDSTFKRLVLTEAQRI